MSSNINGFFNRVGGLLNKASDLSSNISSWIGKASGKDNTFLTPSFNSTQRTDSLFRRLAMNYAPAQQTQEVKTPPKIYTGSEQFKVRVKTAPPDPQEVADQVIKQIGFTAQDIADYKAKHNNVDPRIDIRNIISECLNNPQCEKNIPSTLPKGKDGTPQGYNVEVQNIPKSVTGPLRDYIVTTREKQKAEYEAKLQDLKDHSTTLIVRDTGKQIIEGAKKHAPVLLTTTTAGIAGAADLVLREPLPLPQVSDIAKNVRLIATGGAAGIAEGAGLATIPAIIVGGAATLTDQQLDQQVLDRITKTANQNRDKIVAAPLPPIEMTAEPNLPQGVPPLKYPPTPPPLTPTVDQSGKVKTVTQTTLPIAPQIVTNTPGRSSQPIPPPPPFVFPNHEDKFNHLTNLWMATSRDQALKDLFAEAAQGGISIESGDEAMRFLDYCAKQQGVPPENIQAVTLGGAIFVRPEFANNVRVLREEMIHTYQQAAGIATNQVVQGEIDARLQMIVNRHVWGIDNNEVREMIQDVRKMRETGKY